MSALYEIPGAFNRLLVRGVPIRYGWSRAERGRVYRTAAVLLVLCQWGCTASGGDTVPADILSLDHLHAYPPGVSPTREIRLVEEMRYGDSERNPLMVGGPEGNLARADGRGRVFVPDRQQNTIHVFAPDGRYLTRLGSAGRDPGEFRIIGTLQAGPKHLYVYDSILQRINVFSLDSLAFSHAVRPERISRPDGDESALIPGDRFFAGRGGRLLMAFRTVLSDDKGEGDGAGRGLYRYYWIDNKGEIVSRRIVQEAGLKYIVEPYRGISMGITLPVYGHSLLAVSPGGTVYSAHSDTFLIRQYDAEGSYRRAIYYPFQKSLLRREDLVKQYDHGFDTPHLRAVKKIALPDTWPALQHMLADDRGRLWVATIVDDQTVYDWWVLDMNHDGKFLARFRWPRGRSVEHIRKDRPYACETDTASGEREIVRYRIFLD